MKFDLGSKNLVLHKEREGNFYVAIFIHHLLSLVKSSHRVPT